MPMPMLCKSFRTNSEAYLHCFSVNNLAYKPYAMLCLCLCYANHFAPILKRNKRQLYVFCAAPSVNTYPNRGRGRKGRRKPQENPLDHWWLQLEAAVGLSADELGKQVLHYDGFAACAYYCIDILLRFVCTCFLCTCPALLSYSVGGLSPQAKSITPCCDIMINSVSVTCIQVLSKSCERTLHCMYEPNVFPI